MVTLALHAHRVAFVVVGARVPGAIPGDLVHDAGHLIVQSPEALGIRGRADVRGQFGQIQHGPAEVLRDPHAFGFAAAVVDVHGVVPVRESDAR